MTTTIHDVARLAGCSIKTVSRVLNDEPHVRPSLRERVRDAIAASDYAPNLSARRLVQQRAGTLGLLVYPRQFPLPPDVLSSALETAQTEGYDLLLHFASGDPSDRGHLAHLLAGRRLDGLVVTPPGDTDPILTELLADHDLPRVFINPLDPGAGAHQVNFEDVPCARELTTLILDAGHRRIAFLKGDPNQRASIDRLAGYTQALAQRGIASEPKWIADSGGTFDGGYRAARLYLSSGARPTAFFAVNDHAALGVLFALQEMNVRVPREISICGFGDLPVSAQVHPGLTTARPPLQDAITRALRLLSCTLRGDPAPPLPLPSSTVIQRGSTGPAPIS